MRILRRVLALLAVAVALPAAALLAPVAYVEAACRGGPVTPAADAPLLAPRHRRAEARTLMTYPEWHIVHAYDDYARVISDGPPHRYGFARAIAQFWTSACDLSRMAPAHGGADLAVRQTMHVIGASFTAEMLLKAAYEETMGRASHALFGRGPLDDLSARQAADYAAFLRQVPWYRWDFRGAAAALGAAATDAPRDRERRAALGAEYRAKALYAEAIAGAVAATGADAPTLRAVVTGADPAALEAVDGVAVIGPVGQGWQIETPRYAAFTGLLPALAATGADFAEIAGNDEIMASFVGPAPEAGAAAGAGAFRTMPRQGYGDVRSLVLMPVGDLLARVRAGAAGLEHVHDY